MYKLAIFDMDGTLLDTIDDLANAANHALSRAGFPTHPREAYKTFVGNGIHNLICRAMAPVTDTASIEQVKAVFRVYYGEHAQDCTQPYPGIPQLLTALKGAGMRLAILSNKPHANVCQLAERYFPGLFDIVLGQREGVPIKPDPAAVLEILTAQDCEKCECAYIGDSGVDMHTGQNAGVHAIGVTWGFRTKQELENAGALAIVHNCAQLEKILVDNCPNTVYTKHQ